MGAARAKRRKSSMASARSSLAGGDLVRVVNLVIISACNISHFIINQMQGELQMRVSLGMARLPAGISWGPQNASSLGSFGR